jgi:DNA-binding MarR family transcriptional regulator
MPARPLPPGLSAEKPVTVANRLNSAAIHLLRRISQEDRTTGLTPARLSVLAVLVYGGATTLGELARKEGVAAPTTSRIVEALVQDGLVARESRPGDRRVVELTATALGRRLMEQGRARRILRLAAELRRLGKGELDTLEKAVGLLERLETAVAAPSKGGSR